MMVLVFFFSFLAMELPAHPARDFESREIFEQKNRIIRLLRPETKQKVALAARSFEGKIASITGDVDYLQTAAIALESQLKRLSPAETDVLFALMMFELWQAEEKVIKEITDELHRIDQAKQMQREYLKKIKAERETRGRAGGGFQELMTKLPSSLTEPAETSETHRLKVKYPKMPPVSAPKNPEKLTASELDYELVVVQTLLSKLEEISEELSLIIQTQVDRRAEILQSLSRIMRKISGTADSVIQNIK